MDGPLKIARFAYDDAEMSALARGIRYEVFVREQGVPEELEYDGEDINATHYLLWWEGKPVATARWRRTEKGIKLERFALLKAYRNKGLGQYILDAVLKDVEKLSHPIYLHSQEKAVNFYERRGFVIVGEAFVEAGITHYKMIWPSNQRNIDPLTA